MYQVKMCALFLIKMEQLIAKEELLEFTKYMVDVLSVAKKKGKKPKMPNGMKKYSWRGS